MEIKALVVGLHHHNDNLVFDSGMKVSVVSDDHNEHSDCAFKILTEGGLFGGYLAESQFYWGSLATRLGAKLSFELKSLINQGYTISEAVVEKIEGRTLKSTKVVLKITLNEPTETSEEVSEPMEEENMELWTTGARNEDFTLVGCGRFDSGVKVGDAVIVDVEKFVIRSNGKIGGTASVFTTDGKKVGVFPQSDRKKQDVVEMGGKCVTGDEIKEARASDTLINEGYFVVDISKDGRYVKVAFGGFEMLPEEINEEKEAETMYEIIAIAEQKMNELLTLYEVETIVEPIVEEETVVEAIVEEETVVEATVDVLDELDALNASIRELKAQKDAIEAEMAIKMARREELAKINAKRIKLIDAIRNELETLDISVLEAMKDCMPSSYKEEGFPSPIVKKVHEGKWLNEEEWEEYVEDYWERGFDVLREQEEELNLNDSKAVKRFVNRIKRFNKKLNQFKNQGYDKILTLYWIKNYNVLRTVCKQFNCYQINW